MKTIPLPRGRWKCRLVVDIPRRQGRGRKTGIRTVLRPLAQCGLALSRWLSDHELVSDAACHRGRRRRAGRRQWHETLAEAHENPTTDQIHALRIAGKRLRYRAELLADLGHVPAKSLVKSLKVLQNELGYWNDSQVLLRFMAKSIGHADFLLGHPDYARALLTEMEKEHQRNDSATAEILKSAEKVREWRFPEEAPEQEPA